ncbi:MAG: uridine kinase [Parasphingorhabdus sp.]|nr:uridine kinase [Parasphingorhabdus sp.]
MTQNRAIGICGGSCSGKTRLTQLLHARLGPERSVILPQDDYFFGLGDAPPGKGGPNFDHPDAVDFASLARHLAAMKTGETIARPQYDFHHHLPRTETVATPPRPIILVDGILILADPATRALLDFSIFVACDAETRLARRLERDVRERGRTAESVRALFEAQVEPMHQHWVEPSKAHADLVIDNSHDRPLEIDDILALLG